MKRTEMVIDVYLAFREAPENPNHEPPSYSDLASILGCSVGAARTAVYRAEEWPRGPWPDWRAIGPYEGSQAALEASIIGVYEPFRGSGCGPTLQAIGQLVGLERRDVSKALRRMRMEGRLPDWMRPLLRRSGPRKQQQSQFTGISD